MNTFGNKTKPTVFLTHESHKLHKEFAVATAVYKTQPVKLNSAGAVVPLAAGDNRNLCIGISIHNAKAGENATIMMKAFATILCKVDPDASAALVAGPVQIKSYESDTTVTPAWGTNVVEAAAATDVDIFGIAIEGGVAGAYVEVIVNP